MFNNPASTKHVKTKSSLRWESINGITRKFLLPLFVVVCLAGDTSTRATTSTTTTSTTASQLANISTRGFVQTGDNILDGGFIIQGTTPKTVIVRAIGPSLTQYGVPDALANPTLELHDVNRTLIASNDDWQHTIIGGIITSDQVSAIQNSGHAPTDPSESAIIATLPPGNYTAIVSGVSNTTGVALVEVFDLSPSTTSILGNISTRGFVQTGDNILDGGFIIQGTTPKTVIVRAIGPSLTQYGVPDALANPTLELHDVNRTLIASNDDWQHTIIGGIITSDQVSAIQNSGHAPTDPSESAIIATLQPGNYTAIVRGVNNTTGVALVEVYDLDPLILGQVSQVISASQGGTITLPSGSSVSIPPGVLPSDQLVTLSLLFSMPNQPPSGLITSVGPSLSLSFAAPSGSGGSTRAATRTTSLPSAPIQFHLDFSSFTDPGFNGSSPLGEFITQTSCSIIFTGLDGTVDLVNKIATISFYPQPFTLQNIRQTIIYVALSNVRPEQCSPPPLGGKFWDGSSFTDYPCPSASPPPGICPQARTLILVHGILSSAEKAFGCFPQIESAGHYDQVLGFDYNWTQGINQSGQQLAAFLNCLSDQGFNNVDIEAHSEGVPVALSAASQTSLPLANMVLLGGPILGTPLTNSTRLVKTVLANYPAEGADCLGSYTLQYILNGQFAQDLSVNSTVLPGIRSAFNNRSQHPTVLQVAGNVPFASCETAALQYAGIDMTNIPYDGIIPVASAEYLLYNGVTVGPFALNHIHLECDPEVIADIGNVVSGTPNPSGCGSVALAITSQTWTPAFGCFGYSGYSLVVTGTASGPIGSSFGVVFTSTCTNEPNLVAASWSGSSGMPPYPMRVSGDPAATDWTLNDSFVMGDDVGLFTIGVCNSDGTSCIWVTPHP
jgi:pimeloyl-ACP methyl ester carboxylesterase